MPSVHTVVIGAGQAGLAASRCLSDRGIEHVVLERGRVAERWLSERWDSLRLLTPNWMSRLPGWSYRGPEPDGYMTAAQAADYLRGYAVDSSAPVLQHREVLRLERRADRFEVVTDAESWSAAAVVVATGWCDVPAVPPTAGRLHRAVTQTHVSGYRNPGSLPDGGVLVVGASATGVQVAHELATAGRHVVLAVGSHSRVPRRYRGRDIFWWLDRIGSLDRTVDDLPERTAGRYEPSLQLVGRPDHQNLDLRTLQDAGVRLAGRLVGIDGSTVGLADDLRRTAASADARMARLLGDIDEFADAHGIAAGAGPPRRPATLAVDDGPRRLDLATAGIANVFWATGYRRCYRWLHLPVLDGEGEIRQYRGVTPVPGLYVLGQRFQYRRRSNLIDGAGRDAREVVDHLAATRGGLRPMEGSRR